MATKLQVNRSAKSNRYCGPAALSLLTGRHVDDVAAMLRRNRARPTAIKGVTNREVLTVLGQCGMSAHPLDTYLPTLARFLKQVKNREAGDAFLINVTHHYIVLKGRKIYDNLHPEGLFLRDWPHRRVRVKCAWLVMPTPAEGAKVTLKINPV